ncbi:hypothetical protein GUJ93_ZPchr0007g4795 [Zizania palustris]|uniref:EF-hand domain-containing protein n=1 Tax=Zizania palustris TaxID=103762 RepID=A0A8J5SK76_ZIZPA|nr:hypothetical protein GUJ93_ZPchr0007g4795 [Zizania palustris]
MEPGAGKITFQSPRRNAAMLGLGELRDDELSDMIREGDIDGDGALDQMEFCILIVRLSPELMHMMPSVFFRGCHLSEIIPVS